MTAISMALNATTFVCSRAVMTSARRSLLLTALLIVPSGVAGAQGPQRLEIGHFKARAILECASAPRNGLIAILVPGTGAHGPEEAMPGSMTLDGKETSIFASFAGAMRDAGFHTLQLGKPGIEFHTTWDMAKFAYDRELYMGLTWNDLLQNVNEAIDYVVAQHPCGASTIVLAGHSEGTMRVSDVAAANPKVRGLVLIGFHGHSLKEMVDFQAYRRPVELFVKPDVDADHDGYITRDEAAKWGKDFAWPWKEGETRVSLADYSESLRTNPDYLKAIDQLAKAPTYKGIWDREPMFDLVARFTIPVLAFTGTADVFTPPSELESLQAACTRAGKQDCETHLVPGLGHFMSAPRPPRGQPLVDMTNGPVDKDFLDLLTRTLSAWREQVHP